MRGQIEDDRHGMKPGLTALALTVAAMSIGLTLGCADQPAEAQRRDASSGRNTQTTDEASLGNRTVTGTVAHATGDGLVVQGHEPGGNDREWAFVVDGGTHVNNAGVNKSVAELHEGDAVTVVFTNHDGKIVAQSVTTAPREIPASGNR